MSASAVRHPDRPLPEAKAALVVREVDLAVEMPALVDVFQRGFKMVVPEARFDWLYRRNPDGVSTAWFVLDETSGEIAGGTAVFPRRVQVQGRPGHVTAWNCGDFCIMPRYRAGGAAIKLRRAARNGVDAGMAAFLYAHPNDRMLPIHLRVGHQPLGRMIRLARPTRLARRDAVGRLGNIGLRLARVDRLGSVDDYEIASTSLPAEIDGLFDRTRHTLGTALVRDRQYLTWRFLEYPLCEYRFVLARRKGALSGYLVYAVTGGQLHIKDWIGTDARAVRTLFSAAVSEAIAAGAASASVTLLENHRDRELIARLGYGRRPETSTAIVYAPAAFDGRDGVTSAAAWYMTVGDRDV
jgi:hypothetical protein